MSSPQSLASILPIRLTSYVCKGFNRGSKELGIPTANLSPEQANRSFDDLPCGIYYGFGRIVSERDESNGNAEDNKVYMTALSIGFNPTYNNKAKTIEPHFIADRSSPDRTASICGETQLRDFYGEEIRLSVIGYLRPELPFEGIEKLKLAIKKDILNAEEILKDYEVDDKLIGEKEWVRGSSPG